MLAGGDGDESAGRHGDTEYVHHLAARIRELEQLKAELDALGVGDKELEGLISEDLAKAVSRHAKEMRRRTKEDRGKEGMKTHLLERFEDDDDQPPEEGAHSNL